MSPKGKAKTIGCMLRALSHNWSRGADLLKSSDDMPTAQLMYEASRSKDTAQKGRSLEGGALAHFVLVGHVPMQLT
jgi:hypothetical protein